MNIVERKHSKKRDAILEMIRSTASHPGAQWVYEQLKPVIPDLSLGTVYRNINFFREEGLVVSLGVVNGEERFDGDVRPHPHLVCRRCGRVVDLPCPDPEAFKAFLDQGLLPRQKPRCLSAQEGIGEERDCFRVDFRRTVFYGLCGSCAEPYFLEKSGKLYQIFI
ncbi:MAG: transcriptional repressor [Spirochaetaceae bacterium]|jgi:Fur family peroxide stress response transcriptional regulator|nr:transcriptional repressor [Spirochaetaceae bacterium]